MKTSFARIVPALLILFLPAPALARIAVEIQTEKEVVVQEDGRQIVRTLPADSVDPGQTLVYTLRYRNDGAEAASNVVIEDPVPAGTAYLPGTAYGEGAEITFSIDGGQSFKKPALLTYEVTLSDGRTERRAASPQTYTHVRWLLPLVPPGGQGEVGFKVRLR